VVGGNGTVVADYNFSEGSGLTVYNTAANAPANSDMQWVLNGSVDGTQWGVSNLQYPKNLLEGFNKAMYSPSSYLISTSSFIIRANMEIEMFTTGPDSPSGTDRLFGFGDGINPASFYIMWLDGKIRVYFDTTQQYIGTTVYSKSDLVKINVIRHSSNFDIYINDVLETTVTNAQALPDITLVGGFIYNSAYADNTTSYILSFKIWELEALNDNRIGQDVDLSFIDGTSSIVPNISERAPSVGNFSWADSGVISAVGKYVTIPADPHALDDTDGIQLIPSENTFDRNPFDAPALVASGIEQGENITYEEIVGDISRFYSTDDNQVNDLLTYSDFPEPVVGSQADFDNGLHYLQLDDQTTNVVRNDYYYKLIDRLFLQ